MKEKTIFYKKVGRRYVPVYEYDQTLMDALPKGSHLIQVYPGGQSTKYNVDPAYAPLIAAGRVNRQRFDAQLIARQFLEVYQLVAAEAGLTLDVPSKENLRLPKTEN